MSKIEISDNLRYFGMIFCPEKLKHFEQTKKRLEAVRQRRIRDLVEAVKPLIEKNLEQVCAQMNEGGRQ